MPVVLGSEAGGTMIHEAVGHGLEADLVDKGMSKFGGRLGEEVAVPEVTVVDDGTDPQRRGTCSVDDEGTPVERTVLIEDGRLVRFMNDLRTARKMGHMPTGNGRRESYEHRPIPRMTNTIIVPGESDPDHHPLSPRGRCQWAGWFYGGGQRRADRNQTMAAKA